jgi:hypothetical protein
MSKKPNREARRRTKKQGLLSHTPLSEIQPRQPLKMPVWQKGSVQGVLYVLALVGFAFSVYSFRPNLDASTSMRRSKYAESETALIASVEF